MLTLRVVDGGIQFAVRAQPKASRNAVVGLHGDALKVAVTAAPAGGKANKGIERVVAEALGVRASAVSVVAGLTARDKVVRVDGLAEADLRRRLSSSLSPRERAPDGASAAEGG